MPVRAVCKASLVERPPPAPASRFETCGVMVWTRGGLHWCRDPDGSEV